MFFRVDNFPSLSKPTRKEVSEDRTVDAKKIVLRVLSTTEGKVGVARALAGK
jgi:hypothetical protein